MTGIDRQELEDLISDAIQDSFEMDWNSRDGARAVVRALEEGKVVKTFERGTQCPTSPTGNCIIDTSMESGPRNCFHCERPIP